ncbi:MAG: hypothetical protein HY904_17930 [Deltaproteobacteria bacterium]|nr:hypothetical protein [Deltaproteobacteria bacterium]
MSLGGHRLLNDRGLRLAIAAIAGVAVIGVLDLYRDSDVRVAADDRPVIAVRVECGDRAAAGAHLTLRRALTATPAIVGKRADEAITGRSGSVDLHFPWPLPPDFTGDVVAAAPGCLQLRAGVTAGTLSLSLQLPRGVTPDGATPVDPPPSAAFPPPAPPEQLAPLRGTGAFSDGRYYLFDGPAPTCTQCHGEAAAQHGRLHGAAPTPAFLSASSALAPARARACAACHAPDALFGRAGGFSCGACHRVDVESLRAGEGLAGRVRVFGLEGDPRPLATGVRPDGDSPAMAVVQHPALASSALCAACHAQRMGAVVVDPTSEEHQAWCAADPARAETGCTGCHMPSGNSPALVDGVAHQLWGVDRPDRPARLHAWEEPRDDVRRRAVRVDARWDGDRLVVRAENTGASHALPGTAPFEAWRIRVITTAPLREGPTVDGGVAGVLLARSYRAADGAACAAPWEAAALAEDTRLAPGQPREWTWRFQHRHAVRVVVEELMLCGRGGEARAWWSLEVGG